MLGGCRYSRSVPRGSHFVACLIVTGCTYDFSLPAEQNQDPCAAGDLEVIVCDDVERTGNALNESFYQDRSETPSIVTDGSRVLEFDPPDHRAEWLKTHPTESVSRARLRFAMRVVQRPGINTRQIAPLRFGQGGGGAAPEARLYLHLLPDGRMRFLEEFDDGTANPNKSFDLPAVDAAFHVYDLEVDLTTASVSLDIDGETALPSGSTFPHLTQIGRSAPVSLLLGANYAPQPEPGREQQAAVILHFDDVLLAVR